MTIHELGEKIKQIAAEKGINEQEIIDGLLPHLENKYQKDYSDEDKIIIEKVKVKIVQKLYNSDRQKVSVNQMTKYDELFDLDRVEHNLADTAFTVLEADGDVFAKKYEIGLTEDGIRKYRNN